MALIIIPIIAYFIGSISSAILVCKLLNLPDPRTQGSQNPGATNVLRIGGKKAALVTLFGDMLKGFLPVLLVSFLHFSPFVIALTLFAAFLGHLFPIFFHFKGGKGVATAIGGLLALNFPAGLLWILTWLFVALITRYASLASIIASIFAPLDIWIFTHQPIYALIISFMSAILIYRHRTNFQKLLAGKENKLGAKKKTSA